MVQVYNNQNYTNPTMQISSLPPLPPLIAYKHSDVKARKPSRSFFSP